MRKSISFWLLSLCLFVISVEGVLSLPTILSQLNNGAQYLVVVCHLAYVISGVLVVYGMWRSLSSTWILVTTWGIGSLGASIGGPLAFSSTTATNYGSIVMIAIAVLLLTSGLLWYVRRNTNTAV